MQRNARLTQAAWNSIEPTLQRIFAIEHVSIKEYMILCSKVQEYCRDQTDNGRLVGVGRAHVIYAALKQFLQKFVSQKAEKIRALPLAEDRLLEYRSTWENYVFSAKITNGTFRYLNQHWVKRHNESLTPLELATGRKAFDADVLCMVIWKEEMFTKIETNVTKAALELLEADRNKERGVRMDLVK
uniref:Cullin domain-containing protein n=1 Tax=Steinernema glaseri TaxID=37863 RepID=A0A1I8A2X7_9BILA